MVPPHWALEFLDVGITKTFPAIKGIALRGVPETPHLKLL
jgi:hypothetical protein